ncbi:MAG TPA: sigma 54-interacting transcriptional regulator, partial [Planctomycetota bacterium]|nr:sigma 54-interacting transcriptional regulator [Planctomycetota bacterium]
MIQLIADHRGKRQVFSFASDAVAVGRGEDNDLRIGSRFVSMRHCRIEIGGDGPAKVVDLDSQNGTRVNGAYVSRRSLNPGDRLEIGPVTLWFQTAPPEAPSEPTAEGEEAAEAQVAIVARTAPSGAAQLRDRLQALCVEYRKLYGEERAAEELENALAAVAVNVFGLPVFGATRESERVVDITRALNSTLDIQKLLALILDSAIELTKSERGFLLMRSEDDAWEVRVARNFDHESIRGGENKISHGIAEQVAASGETTVAVDAQQDERFQAYASVNQLKLRSIMCVPLKRRGDVMGVLYLDNRFKDGLYGEREKRMIETFADQAVIALENARLFAAAEALAERTKTLENEAQQLHARLVEAREDPVVPAAPRTRQGLKYDYSRIIGDSPALIAILTMLDRVVESDLPVLITGESGTGKELIARALHENSRRKHNAFVRENCAAIPETLLESELFGYKRGAFTGAQGDKVGLFQQADHGTIFLDEIGEMSMGMQAKLMRVLQDGEIRPVGARESVMVDVRLISATNRDLRRMASEGRFREDLFFRLNVVAVHMPPLRDRPEDVEPLVSHFLAQIAEKTGGGAPKRIEPTALRALRRYHWPGNIRELQNTIER